MSKKNIIKDLKRMKLIPTKKQHEQLMLIGTICLLVLITGLAMWGAWKYPIPHHYYDNMTFPANHYSNIVIMFKKLINEYGIVIFPFLLLTSIFAYEAIYMLLLELWCIAYGLLYY